jgi:hypothetical protein
MPRLADRAFGRAEFSARIFWKQLRYRATVAARWACRKRNRWSGLRQRDPAEFTCAENRGAVHRQAGVEPPESRFPLDQTSALSSVKCGGQLGFAVAAIAAHAAELSGGGIFAAGTRAARSRLSARHGQRRRGGGRRISFTRRKSPATPTVAQRDRSALRARPGRRAECRSRFMTASSGCGAARPCP